MTEPLDWARVPTSSLADPKLRKRMRTWETVNARAGRSITARHDQDAGQLVLEAWQQAAGPGPQARTIDSFLDHPGLTEQIAAALGYARRPWRPAGIKEAIGVPAIHRALSLISTTGGSLSMEAWRRGTRLSPDDRPRLIVRPNPFTTARDFYRDTIYSMGSRGETWWWVAARDGDGMALSIIPVPPHEVRVEENPNDLRYPDIYWRDRLMPRGDMVQITLMREPGELRGYGPLQMCGAAVSVAVEAQEWAANFFAAGGYPNIWIKTSMPLSGDPDDWSTDKQTEDGALSEAQRLKNEWISTAPNTPKVTDDSIEDIKQFDPNPQGAQMLDARDHQNGDVARMFGIPGSLLDYKASGSNLTYQNLEQEMTKFLRTCLIPYYLEPIEQAMSDLLTGQTVARFNVSEVNRADEKTRWEVYDIATRVLGPEDAADYARIREGLAPGNVETAPVPLAPPSAIPANLPVQARTAEPAEVRCDGMTTKRRSGTTYVARCKRLLSKTGSFEGACPRCGKVYDPSVAA